MHRIVSFGEIMLRLKSPANERFFQSPALEATFGGGEANVAVSLAMLGESAAFVTALPDNPIGESALRELRRYSVDTSAIKRTKGRLGIYFLETGANQRPSNVVYDRDGSCISAVKPGDFDWSAILKGADWFHITGITPALSLSVAEAALEAVKAAKAAGTRVSIDLNYRKKLWNYGKKAPEVMRGLAAHADIVVANEEDVQMCLGIEPEHVDVTKGKLGTAATPGHPVFELAKTRQAMPRCPPLPAARGGYPVPLAIRRRVTPLLPQVGSGATSGRTFQMSSQYWRIARSEENPPILATLRIDLRIHAGSSIQQRLTCSWQST